MNILDNSGYMKIVVLDGYTLNPGDLSWDALRQLGEVTVYDRTSPQQVWERSADAEILFTNKVVLDAATVGNLPKLRYIGVLATGYNVVDLEAARKAGVVVTNIPAYSTDSVAQMAFSHILNIVQRVDVYAHEIRDGKWSGQADFCYWNSPLHELKGKKLGVVGFGNTGKATARIAVAFGMEVCVYTSKPAAQLPEGVGKCRSLDELFRECDIVSLHCPLTGDTEGMIDSERLKMMKPTAILINTGRGGLVNERDLAEALADGTIAAAGVDVLASEPPSPDNPLLKQKNCFITPHIAWATYEARVRLMELAIGNLTAFLEGNPVNVVS